MATKPRGRFEAQHQNQQPGCHVYVQRPPPQEEMVQIERPPHAAARRGSGVPVPSRDGSMCRSLYVRPEHPRH